MTILKVAAVSAVALIGAVSPAAATIAPGRQVQGTPTGPGKGVAASTAAPGRQAQGSTPGSARGVAASGAAPRHKK